MQETPNRHSVILLEPNLLFLTLVGDISIEDVRALRQQHLRLITPGPVYRLLDVTRFGTIGPEARKLAVEYSMEVPYKAMACFGASFQMRVLLTLLITARSLLMSQPMPTIFTKTEAEARAWLDQQRRAASKTPPEPSSQRAKTE